jgi:hypothetical protein
MEPIGPRFPAATSCACASIPKRKQNQQLSLDTSEVFASRASTFNLNRFRCSNLNSVPRRWFTLIRLFLRRLKTQTLFLDYSSARGRRIFARSPNLVPAFFINWCRFCEGLSIRSAAYFSADVRSYGCRCAASHEGKDTITRRVRDCRKAKIYRPLPRSLSGRLVIEALNRTVMTTPSERTWEYRPALIGLAGS